MEYRNTEMKLDQLVAYFNEEKVNLSPAFQRGQVWKLKTRQKLVANIVQRKPIPAVFLYKEASGARYSYNILDGKQRLESIMLFIGSERTGSGEMRVKNWQKYFFDPRLRLQANFSVDLPTGRTTFATLPADVVRDLREYSIPTVEITLQDDSTLDEIISLFLDINQQGVPVSRFDIVKAMGRQNRLLKSVFDIIAVKETRGQVEHYKSKRNDFTAVFKHLSTVSSLGDSKSRVERQWQILLELAMFQESRRHRKPIDILKSFIRASRDAEGGNIAALKSKDAKALRAVFAFLSRAYRVPSLKSSSLATDHTRFYSLATTLIAHPFLEAMDEDELIRRIETVSQLIDGKKHLAGNPRVTKAVKKFLGLVSDRTTDTPRRDDRHLALVEAIEQQ